MRGVRCISLHIGLPHAGSTSIQACLLQNRATLLEAGILFPKSLGKRAHGSLVSYALEAGTLDVRRRRMGIDGRAAVAAFRAELEDDLAAEIAAAPSVTRAVFSAEQLSWELHRRSEVERLAALLRRFGAVDRVVLYLRPQSDLWISHYVNGIKRGRAKAPMLFSMLANLRQLDYRRTVSLWADVFGREALRVRLLDPSAFAGGGLHDDFAAAAALPAAALPVRPRVQNEGLGAEAVALLQRLNRGRGSAADTMSTEDHARVAAMRAVGGGPKLGVPSYLRSLIRVRFERGNAAVAKDFFGRDRLFEDAAEPARAPLTAIGETRAQSFAQTVMAARPKKPGKRKAAARRTR